MGHLFQATRVPRSKLSRITTRGNFATRSRNSEEAESDGERFRLFEANGCAALARRVAREQSHHCGCNFADSLGPEANHLGAACTHHSEHREPQQRGDRLAIAEA